VKTGVQAIYKFLKIMDSGAFPGPDPGFAGMTGNLNFRVFKGPSLFKHPRLNPSLPPFTKGRNSPL
jgi:hypothetical protein